MNTTSINFRYWLSGAAGLLLVLSTGCNRDNVKVYHVEKDDSVTPPPPAAASAAPAANDTANAMPPNVTPATPQIAYTLPEGWQETAPSQMRVASFTVANPDGKPADVGVIPMPAGSQDIQLVNMWRQQMQLPAATDADADKLSESVSIGDGT